MTNKFQSYFKNLPKPPSFIDFKTSRNIEQNWQKILSESTVKTTKLADSKYVLAMFPYPSGKIHLGHARVYLGAQIFTNYLKKCGYKVF